jgi:diamine N-acetyltransferase
MGYALSQKEQARSAAESPVSGQDGMTIISGAAVTLRSAQESDRRAMYEWLVESDVTPSMMGPPLFPDVPLPTWREFCDDYGPLLFDGSRPEREGSYIVEVGGEALGQVNYEVTGPGQGSQELDIWLRSEADCGHGYGPDALTALTRHLHDTIGAQEFIIRPSKRNRRAVRAYMKAGFVLVPMTQKRQAERYGPGDYSDTVVLRLRLLT